MKKLAASALTALLVMGLALSAHADQIINVSTAT